LPPSQQQQQQPTSRTQQNKCKEKSLPCALGLFTKPCYLCTLDNTILPNALSKTHKLYMNANSSVQSKSMNMQSEETP
jgi:hypothetical protein